LSDPSKPLLDFFRSGGNVARREELEALVKANTPEGFKFTKAPLDILRGPTSLLRREFLELKLAKVKEAQNARAMAVAATALQGTNPGKEELAAFDPSTATPFPSMLGTTGASPTTDPMGAEADLQAELRNEELNRASEQNAGAAEALAQRFRLKNAGINPNDIALDRKRNAEGSAAELRLGALRAVLSREDIDPMVAADVANRKAVSAPRRVKVRRRDGTEVYYNETRTPGGQLVYTPAADKQGRALRVPASSSGDRRTNLQKDTQFIMKVMDINEKDALKMKLALKTKSPKEAWVQLVKETTKLSYGRYARDPAKLREKAAEIWEVQRPGEPIPGDVSSPATPASAGSEHAEERQRAIGEGYNNLGVWIEGKGFQVFDDQGSVIGYYN